MPIFEKKSHIDAPSERVFAFHAHPDALRLLIPPWESMRVISKTPGLDVGTEAVVEAKVGPFTQRIVAEHTLFEAGRMFRDEQRSGPFAHWIHTHTVEPDDKGGCWLVDHVDYALPLGALGQLGGGWYVRRKLARLFDYRHRITRESCEAPLA